MRYVLLLVVLLSGCAIDRDRSARLERNYGPTCKGLGLEKGTQAYTDCLLKLNGTSP